MSRAWRLCRERHAALDGEGARRGGGRWNSAGTPVVYASSTLSLAALEMLVHIDPAEAPPDLVALELNIPDDITWDQWSVSSLPSDWRSTSIPIACQQYGERWIKKGNTLAAAAPSVIIPSEYNVLMNPRHPTMPRVSVVSSSHFTFDPRLLINP